MCCWIISPFYHFYIDICCFIITYRDAETGDTLQDTEDVNLQFLSPDLYHAHLLPKRAWLFNTCKVTWRHLSRDHSTWHRPFPIGGALLSEEGREWREWVRKEGREGEGKGRRREEGRGKGEAKVNLPHPRAKILAAALVACPLSLMHYTTASTELTEREYTAMPTYRIDRTSNPQDVAAAIVALIRNRFAELKLNRRRE